MKIHQAFEIVRGDVVAFIGAGGKTSTLVNLGYELAELGWRVLATTTTRIGEDQLQFFPSTLYYQEDPYIISSELSDHKFVFLYDRIEGDKVYGIPPERIAALIDSVDSDVLLIEADGARGLPFKAPYDHEPVIPAETSLVVPVVSLSAIGQSLDKDHIYNPEAMTKKYGFYPGGRIRSPWIAQILRDEEFGLKGIPEKARTIALLNRVGDKGYMRNRARLIARLALRSTKLQGVAMGSVRSADPIYEVQRSVGAIVLAAGMSTRMGEHKILLPWDEGKTIIEHIIEQLIRCRIENIVVVTGHNADKVKEIVKPFEVKTVYNRAYKTGEMVSSLKAGLRAMPDHIAASMVVLGDQPLIQPKTIQQVLMAYAEGKGDIIAPSYQGQRGHPILISQRYWSEFLALKNNQAPREVLQQYSDQVVCIPVDSDSVIQDIDTLSDYQQARIRAGLKK